MNENLYAPPRAQSNHDESSVDIARARKYYRRVTVAIMVFAMAIFAMVVGAMNESPAMVGLASLALLCSAVMYYVFIGFLAAANQKSPLLWSGLTFLTSPLGILVSYFMMQDVGKKNKWR